MHRLTEVKHDVVSNVDGQRQRAHACGFETLDHPARSRSVGVRAAHDTSNETVHTDATADRGVVGEYDRETVGVRSRRLSRDHAGQPRIAERRTRRVRVLASNAAHREAVAAVRGHVDLEDLFAQPQPGNNVRTDGRNLAVREVLRQHDDAVMVLPQSEFARGTDHAVRDVTVGLARGDLEVSGQNCPGQRHDDQVVDVEVVGTADDAAARQLRGLLAGAGSIVVLADIHAAVVHDLAVRGGLLHTGEDATHHERAGDSRRVNLFLFKADLHEGGGKRLGIRALGNINVVGQPAQRNHRHVSYPFHSLRTAGRSERLPQRCHACRRCRDAASACARYPCRTRSPSKPRGRRRWRAARSG